MPELLNSLTLLHIRNCPAFMTLWTRGPHIVAEESIILLLSCLRHRLGLGLSGLFDLAVDWTNRHFHH